jgi:hypothetical protein
VRWTCRAMISPLCIHEMLRMHETGVITFDAFCYNKIITQFFSWQCIFVVIFLCCDLILSSVLHQTVMQFKRSITIIYECIIIFVLKNCNVNFIYFLCCFTPIHYILFCYSSVHVTEFGRQKTSISLVEGVKFVFITTDWGVWDYKYS